MKVLRTPDQRFETLPGFDYEPHYTDIPDGDGGTLRIHHVDEGPKDAPIILCMHGQPTWSYLYRHMIEVFKANGLRTIAPDLPGFGRSDKPSAREDYTYNGQVDWMNAWLRENGITGATLVGQDWGGLIGLRMVAENPDRFDRVVVANTGLPVPVERTEEEVARIREFRSASTPTPTMEEMVAAIGGLDREKYALGFAYWQKWTWETEDIPVGMLVGGMSGLSPEEMAAYDAPFPDPSYKMGPRAMPSQVPTLHGDPSTERQLAAWKVFSEWQKPLLCAFADDDPVTRGAEEIFKTRVPGAAGQNHQTIEGGGHFLQEGRGQELAEIVTEFVRSTAVA